MSVVKQTGYMELYSELYHLLSENILNDDEGVWSQEGWFTSVIHISVCSKKETGWWIFKNKKKTPHVYLEDWTEESIKAYTLDERGEEIVNELVKIDPRKRKIYLSSGRLHPEEEST